MLKSGIYEQIINEEIGRQLQELDVPDYDKEAMQADDARHILTIYLSHVIEKGLRYIRESFPADQDEEALLAQIRLCNDIIERIASHVASVGPDSGTLDVEDNEILEKGEILTVIWDKMNSASALSGRVRSVSLIRPQTSIVENALFTGSPVEPAMMSELGREIESADRIDLLVSFIRMSAVGPLLSHLERFARKKNGLRLRVIATTYMQATEYKAILTLAGLPNTEVRINYETKHARLHAKAYYFYRDTGFSTAYIGSSNLSGAALNTGLEWNVKVTEQESFELLKKCEVTFDSYWNDASFETFDPEDEECCRKLQSALAAPGHGPHPESHISLDMRPYAYQEEILNQLAAEREIYGHFRNLVVAPTGVGKTFIAAFDYRRYREAHPNARLLFVAHRKEILQQSLAAFRVILNDYNFGELFVDGKHPSSFEYLFMSIQSFQTSRLSEQLNPEWFQFVVVDEFHHAAAPTYLRLLSWCKPEILLGMTATPERMDGKNVLEAFNGTIASSMLLGDAISRDLLCPFQYYGVTDSEDYRDVKWTRGQYDVQELERRYLSADYKRAMLVLKTVMRYGPDLQKIRGLGFCVSVRHAEYMAAYFNSKNIPSLALSGESLESDRESAKKRLEKGEILFIFTVDLYNEGVDIPCINTILFLRPTQSATVFLQQLGRGLRRYPGKDCLTVLDLIGQSSRHYRFDTKLKALTGKGGKKQIQRQVDQGFSNLPAGCYIELETQAKEYILETLRQSDNRLKEMIEHVRTFEEDTGRKLTLADFLDEYDLSLYEFYHNDGSRSMHFLKQEARLLPSDDISGASNECNASLTSDAIKSASPSGQSIRDAEKKSFSAMTGLFHIDSVPLLDYWIRYLEGDTVPRSESERLMRNMLYYTFYRKCPSKMNFRSIADGIERILQPAYVRSEALEILLFRRNHIDFVAEENEYSFFCPLQVHCRYSTPQIMAAMGYFNENEAKEFREGVKYFPEKKADIFLINLNKSEKEFSPSTMYEDYAVNAHLFHWQSQSRDRDTSSKIARYIHHRETGNQISLFVREFKHNGSYTAPYTFLGNADYVKHEGSQPVSFLWRLHQPMPAWLLPKANKTIAM